MPASKKLIRVVLPVATATATTIATASLLSFKQFDPDAQLKPKEIDLEKFEEVNEDFDEKVFLFTEEGKGESVEQKDVEKAKEIIDSLQEDGTFGDLQNFDTPEEAVKFLETLPEKVLDSLVNDPKNDALHLDSKALNNLGKVGDKLRSKQEQQQNRGGIQGQSPSQQIPPNSAQGPQRMPQANNGLSNSNIWDREDSIGGEEQNFDSSRELSEGTGEQNTGERFNKGQSLNMRNDDSVSSRDSLETRAQDIDSGGEERRGESNLKDNQVSEGSLNPKSDSQGTSIEDKSKKDPHGNQASEDGNISEQSPNAEGLLNEAQELSGKVLSPESSSGSEVNIPSQNRDGSTGQNPNSHEQGEHELDMSQVPEGTESERGSQKSKGNPSPDSSSSESPSELAYPEGRKKGPSGDKKEINLMEDPFSSAHERGSSLGKPSSLDETNRDLSDRSDMSSSQKVSNPSHNQDKGNSEYPSLDDEGLSLDSLFEALGGNGSEVNIQELEKWEGKLERTGQDLNNLIVKSSQ